jgi:hypothetical protein
MVYKLLFRECPGRGFGTPRGWLRGARSAFISHIGAIIWYINTNLGMPWAGFGHPEGLVEGR